MCSCSFKLNLSKCYISLDPSENDTKVFLLAKDFNLILYYLCKRAKNILNKTRMVSVNFRNSILKLIGKFI